MIKTLTDILIEALVGKKIQLYRVEDKRFNHMGNKYYITDKGYLLHPKNCVIIGQEIGTITNIETSDCGYEGDDYVFTVIDSDGNVLDIHSLHSITCIIEIIE